MFSLNVHSDTAANESRGGSLCLKNGNGNIDNVPYKTVTPIGQYGRLKAQENGLQIKESCLV